MAKSSLSWNTFCKPDQQASPYAPTLTPTSSTKDDFHKNSKKNRTVSTVTMKHIIQLNSIRYMHTETENTVQKPDPIHNKKYEICKQKKGGGSVVN